jgi:hypothetical protein
MPMFLRHIIFGAVAHTLFSFSFWLFLSTHFKLPPPEQTFPESEL